jgi:hypothetical protein
MKKVKNANQAIEVFQLLGIKDVTKDWQRSKGTKVFELPFKTMYANGHTEVNRFSIYKSGYVRKMLVNSKGASYCCYQLNRTRGVEEYYKDYEWDELKMERVWKGKYRKSNRKKRIMIPNYEDRLVYLCNYILKNYYRTQKSASFYRINDYQASLIKKLSEETRENYNRNEQLPFKSKEVFVEPLPEDDKFFSSTDDVQVIINGHRYNLS